MGALHLELEHGFAIAVAGIFCLSIVAKMVGGSGPSSNREKYSAAKGLVNQAVKWASMANQDSNPVYAMRHTNYANAYLIAARTLVPDSGLEQATGRDIHSLEASLRKLQSECVAVLSKTCPKTLPKGTTITNWL